MFVLLVVLLCVPSRPTLGEQVFNRTDPKRCDAIFSARNYSAGSVLIFWELLECDNIVHPIQVSCTAEHRYTMSNNEPALDQIHVDHFLPPAVSGEALIEVALHAHYSCRASVHHNGRTILEAELSFQSEAGVPNPPPAPVVISSPTPNLLYSIELYNSSTYNSPISGYGVQFHVMDAIPVDHFGYINIEDFYRPHGSMVTIENARGSKTPISFIIHYQSVGRLPKQIDIDQNLLDGALKKGAVYTVIVEAYYEKQPNRTLFSRSRHSEVIFIPQDNATDSEALEDDEKSHQHVLPILIALSFVVVLLIAAFCIAWKKLKRNQEKLRKLSIFTLASFPPDIRSLGKFPGIMLAQVHTPVIFYHRKQPKFDLLQDKKEPAFREDRPDYETSVEFLPISNPSPDSIAVYSSVRDSSKKPEMQSILCSDSAVGDKVSTLSDSNTARKSEMLPLTTQGSVDDGETCATLDQSAGNQRSSFSASQSGAVKPDELGLCLGVGLATSNPFSST